MRKFGPDPDLFCFVEPKVAHELGLSEFVAPTTNRDGMDGEEAAQAPTSAVSAAEKAAQKAKVEKELDFNAPKVKAPKPKKEKKIKRPVKKNKK